MYVHCVQYSKYHQLGRFFNVRVERAMFTCDMLGTLVRMWSVNCMQCMMMMRV